MQSIAYASPKPRWTAARLGTVAWALWALAIAGVLGRAMAAPQRNSVFGVFRDAGQSWLTGGDLYSHVGKYLYSPLAAALFSPFAFLPESVGGALWRLITLGVYLSTFVLWLRHFGKNLISPERFPVAMLLLLPASLGNLNNGQASLLVIGLILGACLAVESQSWALGALLMALAGFFKIYPLAIGLLLVVVYPRQFGPRLLLSLLGLWLLSLVLQQPAYVLKQYYAWFECLRSDQRRVLGDLGTWRDFWLLLRLTRIPITLTLYSGLQVLTGVGLAAFCWWARQIARWKTRKLVWSAFALGCLWIVLFGPSTELATYVFLGPLLAFVGAAIWESIHRSERGSLAFGAWFLATYLFFIGAEALNAWVPAVRRNIELHALQPIAALSLTIFIFAWTLREKGGQRVSGVLGSFE